MQKKFQKDRDDRKKQHKQERIDAKLNKGVCCPQLYCSGLIKRRRAKAREEVVMEARSGLDLRAASQRAARENSLCVSVSCSNFTFVPGH